jgi:hypothetical protein
VRNLVYTGFMSLDGGPGEEHRSGGWVFKDLEFVPEAWSLKGEELTGTTALMFGRPRGVDPRRVRHPRREP